MSKNKPNLTAILPALNEEASIEKTIIAIRRVYPSARILVVDNGSSDNTVAIAEKLKATVIHEPQKGKGFAVRAAFSHLDFDTDAVFMVDADDTYGMEKLIYSMDLIIRKGYDMIIGNRTEIDVRDENRKNEFRMGHTIGNKFFTWLSKLLYPVNINDSLSGWRVMSPEFIRSFPGGASGFEVESELNAHAFMVKANCFNVDVGYRGRGENSHSKLNTYRDGFRILRMNLSNFKNDRPALAFNLIATPWLILSLILILRAIDSFLKTGMVVQFPSLIAGVGAFIVSALLWITGMILQRLKLIRSNLIQFEFRRKVR